MQAQARGLHMDVSKEQKTVPSFKHAHCAKLQNQLDKGHFKTSLKG